MKGTEPRELRSEADFAIPSTFFPDQKYRINLSTKEEWESSASSFPAMETSVTQIDSKKENWQEKCTDAEEVRV